MQRMKGIEREEPKNGPEQADENASVQLTAEFYPEQGVLKCAWRTDVGKIRKNNQDAVILGNGLAGVADGMGGHKGGEIASAGLRDGLIRETKDAMPSEDRLTEAVRRVNLELWERQEKDPSLSGMGTTLTILWPAEGKMLIGQVGDSRAYLLRDGELTQVTSDHSMVADMVRKGILTEEQASCHPMRNYITRAVGTDEDVEVDLTVKERCIGDRWLICSDGLHGMVDKNDLRAMLMNEDLEAAAENLLQAALDNGGKDNISLVILEDQTETLPEEEKETGNPDETEKAETAENGAGGEVAPQ